MYIVNIPVHLTPWRRAGELRDRLERAAVTNRLMTVCPSIHLAGLPDNVDGAYVLRNGAAEAFRRDVGKDIRAAEPLECSFAWDNRREDFVQARR